jgi:autotransporter-associated beta strand protein
VAGITTAGTGSPQTITNGNGSTLSTLTVVPTSGNYSYAGLLSANLGLVKAGTGSLTLSNPTGNTYGGGTTVNSGTLYVTNTSNSATGSGKLLVNSNGTLAGNGTVNVSGGSVTVAGTVHPGTTNGATIEALSVNAITFLPGSNLNVDVQSQVNPGSSNAYHDYLKVTGSSGLDLTNIAMSLTLAGTHTQGQEYITLVDQTNTSAPLSGVLSSLSVNGTPIASGGVHNNTEFVDVNGDILTANQYGTDYGWDPSNIPANTTFWWLLYNVQADSITPGGNDVVLVNVPEPSTLVMVVAGALMGLGGLAWRRKRHAGRRSA